MTRDSTTIDTATIVRLDDHRALDGDLAGGKAATLARLLQDGLPVPAGFVVTAEAVARCRSDATDDAQGVRFAIADDVADEIAAALDVLGGGRVAVRSSAVAEDQSEASFAGQYETVLDVEGTDAVVAAIGRVVDSAWTARVAGYRRARGSDDARLAVLVQRMVPASAAGVAFSANPVTGARDETLVHAAPGLGEALVGGETAPDEFVVRDGECEVIATPHGSIDADRARDVAALTDRLERMLGAPQDVEWAWGPDGLHVIQSRPITALPIRPEIDLPDGTWTKDTVHYPEPVTPLGDVFLDALEDGSSLMCREWGLLVDHIDQMSVGGEIYGRPVPVGGKDTGPTPPWWLVAVLARIVPPMRRRLRNAASAVGSGALEALPDRWDAELKPRLRERIAALRDVDLGALDVSGLVAHLDETIELLHEGQRIHFRLFIPYAVGVHELATETARLLDWTSGQTMELLQGLSATSSEPAVALEALADLVRDHPAARDALDDPEHLLSRLEALDPRIAEAVRSYRDDWGFRTLNYDPGAPTVAERPELLANLLRDAVDRHDTRRRDGVHAAREDACARAHRELDERGVATPDRQRFADALAYAERVYPLREDNLFWTDNVPTALVRRAALEIGRRLADRGRIDRAEDAVWLHADELRERLRDASDAVDLRDRIERRKGERRYVRANPGPKLIGPEPSPPPDVRGLPEPARRTNQAVMWLMGLEGYVPGDEDDRPEADLAGTPASAGEHTGTVRIVRGEEHFDRVRPGDVLVAPITAPAWSVLFAQAGAVVTETGGVLSHAAIVAREYGIPAVLGVADATTRLADGATVTVDGRAGTITTHRQGPPVE